MGLLPLLGAGIFSQTDTGKELIGGMTKMATDAFDPNRGKSEFESRPTEGLDYQSYADAIRRSQERSFGAGAEQDALMGSLRGAAEGAGPSVAELALQQATDENARAGVGLLASQRGLSPALGARMAGNMASRTRQQAVGQGALLRAQEMLANRSLYANALAQKRAQDMGMFGAAGQLSGGQNEQRIRESLGRQGLEQSTAEGNAARRQQALDENVRRFTDMASGAGDTTSKAGEALVKAAPMLAAHGGGRVPGGARVAGDHPANDRVPARLSPGEVVLPRSVGLDPERAAAFVRALRDRPGFDAGLRRAMQARGART